MSYVQKIFSGTLEDKDYIPFSEKTSNAVKVVTGVLIHPEGTDQRITVTLRHKRGSKAVFRKIQFKKTEEIDGIPYDLSKNFHPLNVRIIQDILTGSIASEGQGKVSIYLRFG